MKKTKHKKKTLSPLFDKSFNFEFQNLKKTQLETMKITIVVKDRGILFDGHLGGYEIDLTSVYFNQDHMFHKTWFTLFDFEEEVEGCIGYVKANIEVLGPDDEPTIVESITDDPSQEKTIISPKIRPEGHLIMAEIYRAEYLSPINFAKRTVDPYIRVKYGGMYKQTKKVSPSSNPDFNQIIFLPAILPNHSKHIFIELWHDAFLNDSLIGTAKIPFNLFKNSNNMKPIWLNIYGPPLSSHNEYSMLMAQNGYKIGTTFRGRLLIRLSSRDEKNPISDVIFMRYRLPELIIPNPLSKVYTLRIDIFEGSVLPTKGKGMLHFCIGPYLIKSSLKMADSGYNIFWNETLAERRITLPLDIKQIPDMVIYFADEDVESHRISYSRKTANKFVVYNSKTNKKFEKPMIVKFREDKSHKRLQKDQFPGFAVIRVMLYAFTPPPRKDNIIIISNKVQKVKYVLMLFTYVARSLASGEDDGTSNPQISYKVGGVEKTSSIKRNTLNPNYYEVINMEIELNNIQNASPPTLMILMYHINIVNGIEKGRSLLGRFWLLLDLDKRKRKKFMINRSKNQFVYINYEKPEWIPMIYDKEDKIDGHLLMGYAIVPKIDYDRYEFDQIKIQPKSKVEDLTMYAFGIRDLEQEMKSKFPQSMSYEIRINGLQTEDLKIMEKVKQLSKDNSKLTEEQMTKKMIQYTNLVPVENQGIHINKKLNFKVQIPFIKELCPIMEVFIYQNTTLNKRKLIGIGQYSLRKPLAYFYKEEEDKDYINKWRDFLQLDKLQKTDDVKKKVQKLKIQKIQPQNQILYFEDMVYEIEDPIGKNNKINELKKVIIKDNDKTIVKSQFRYKEDEKAQLAQNLGNFQYVTSRMINNLRVEVDDGDLDVYKIQNDQSIAIDKVEIADDQKPQLVKDLDDIQEESQIPEIKQLKSIKEVSDYNNSQIQGQLKRQKSIKNDSETLELEMSNLNPKKLQNSSLVHLKKSRTLQRNTRLTRLSMFQLKEKNQYMNNDQIKEKFKNNEQLELDLNKDLEVDMDSYFQESEEISNFELQLDQSIKEKSGEVSQKNLSYDDLFVEENQDAKDKKNKSEMQKWMSKLRIKNPFAGLFKKKIKEITYQDYDTDEDEEFDDVLPYLKGRKEFQDDLEDGIFSDLRKKAVDFIYLYRGNQRLNEKGFFSSNEKDQHRVGRFKFLFVRENRPDLVPFKKISNFLNSVSKPKEYIARVYIMRGLQITSLNDQDVPKTFLRLKFNKEKPIEDNDSEREGQYPEYYRVHEFPIKELPGTAILRIDIVEKGMLGTKKLLGYTEIDLEERNFSIKWNKWEKKPVEKRNIVNDLYGSRGRLEMWIDILPAKNREPRTVIYPKVQLPYELRVIVWETKDCVFKDIITKANDLFARGGVMRGDNFLETDTHWRCRNKGSFNWRWKFQVHLPVDENKNYGEDRFVIQLWDRDIIARNDLIGEFEVDLNIHKMLQKAHFRKKSVEMRRRESESGQETNMLWFNVFHPEKIDTQGNKISQGKVCLSFEILPEDFAEKFENAVGRAEPNFYPTLPQPVGRFSFDLMSPCKTIKGIIGPDLCYKIIYAICYILFLIILIMVGYYAFTSYIGVKLASI